jgi:hypothetical protein
MTWEVPSPLTTMSWLMKLVRFRLAPAACSACAVAVRPVAMAWTWLTTASDSALLCGTTLPVMMRASAEYTGSSFAVMSEIAAMGTATQMAISSQYWRSRRAAISSTCMKPPR